MDRIAIKLQARDILQKDRSKILIASFLFLAITALFSALSFLLTMPSMGDLRQMLQLARAENYEALLARYNSWEIGTVETIVSDLLRILQAIVYVGFLMLLLRAIRGQDFVYGNLLDGFSMWLRVLVLDLLTSLLITLWTMLLVIPGIVAAYKYRMARYLLITHPEYSPIECILESKRRMQGHKQELFMLDLSFLGWALLCSIPVVGWLLSLWVLPYYESANLLYCEQISAPFDLPPMEENPYSF